MSTNIFSTDIISEIEDNVNEPLYRTLAKAENIVINTQDLRKKMYKYYLSVGKLAQAKAVMECGNFLMFKTYEDKDRTSQLSRANFCKNPLCPMCAWRKHLRHSAVMSHALNNVQGKLSHLVLAVPNTDTITKERLMYLKERGKTFIQQKLNTNDYVINLEIVASEKGFHPHLHILLRTDDYFKVSEDTIRNYSELWKRHFAKKDTYNYTREYEGYTFYIRGLNANSVEDMQKIILETTKYILKSEVSVSQELVGQTLTAIHGVRKMNSAGAFKEAIKKGKLLAIKEADERLYELSKYNWVWEIFNFINGKYVKK